MGYLQGIPWYFSNLAMAAWRLVWSILTTWKRPLTPLKRLDSLIGALFGIHYSTTISRVAGWNIKMLWTVPIGWVTNVFDDDHLLESAKPYPPGPGMRYFPLGLVLVGSIFKLTGCV